MNNTRKFTLKSPFQPTGDQPDAINTLIQGIQNAVPEQVLLGVTGSGKTYTMAKVIEKIQRPTLIISHNKTLAMQLYQEFRDFFPDNAVSYFVSYYDYYQPEAYIPQTDTYIEKETQINDEIDKLRLAATTNILTRKDTIVVASVSCIYNIGSPTEYDQFTLELQPGAGISRDQLCMRLRQLQYERNDTAFQRGTFRIRGEHIDIFPAYEDTAIRLTYHRHDTITGLQRFDPVTGSILHTEHAAMAIYPAKHYMTDPEKYKKVFQSILQDVDMQEEYFRKKGKLIEAQRIRQRVTYDIEMIQELGYVNGIENYSRYFDGRNPGDAPYTLMDYLSHSAGRQWLMFIDESHMTIPQIRGMYEGDKSRKQTLIEYGFRLPAAIDNRPLRFEEFLGRIPQTVYISATPDTWEKSRADGHIAEQLIRPTGLLDPVVVIRPVQGQVQDLLREIQARVAKKERVLVTTLTKKSAEDLAAYIKEHGILVQYLHADVETLERSDILADLRGGTYDVVVGINLLREGLDLPEVSLVAVLDADKEGFLRSKTTLIQTMGRAARHENGMVILYADVQTKSIIAAVLEVERRRNAQIAYNKKYGITPESIHKPIRRRAVEKQSEPDMPSAISISDIDALTPLDRKKKISELVKQMRRASRDLDFEGAAKLRDMIIQLGGKPYPDALK